MPSIKAELFFGMLRCQQVPTHSNLVVECRYCPWVSSAPWSVQKQENPRCWIFSNSLENDWYFWRLSNFQYRESEFDHGCRMRMQIIGTMHEWSETESSSNEFLWIFWINYRLFARVDCRCMIFKPSVVRLFTFAQNVYINCIIPQCLFLCSSDLYRICC